jgi:hypothetical protein
MQHFALRPLQQYDDSGLLRCSYVMLKCKNGTLTCKKTFGEFRSLTFWCPVSIFPVILLYIINKSLVDFCTSRSHQDELKGMSPPVFSVSIRLVIGLSIRFWASFRFVCLVRDIYKHSLEIDRFPFYRFLPII